MKETIMIGNLDEFMGEHSVVLVTNSTRTHDKVLTRTLDDQIRIGSFDPNPRVVDPKTPIWRAPTLEGSYAILLLHDDDIVFLCNQDDMLVFDDGTNKRVDPVKLIQESIMK